MTGNRQNIGDLVASASSGELRAFLLSRLVGLSGAEIGAELGATEVNARKLVSRAIARIMMQLP